jgi:hypothetical protein
LANQIAFKPRIGEDRRCSPYGAQLNVRARPTTKAAIAEVSLESGRPLAHLVDAAIPDYVARRRDGRLA